MVPLAMERGGGVGGGLQRGNTEDGARRKHLKTPAGRRGRDHPPSHSGPCLPSTPLGPPIPLASRLPPSRRAGAGGADWGPPTRGGAGKNLKTPLWPWGRGSPGGLHCRRAPAPPDAPHSPFPGQPELTRLLAMAGAGRAGLPASRSAPALSVLSVSSAAANFSSASSRRPAPLSTAPKRAPAVPGRPVGSTPTRDPKPPVPEWAAGRLCPSLLRGLSCGVSPPLAEAFHSRGGAVSWLSFAPSCKESVPFPHHHEHHEWGATMNGGPP